MGTLLKVGSPGWMVAKLYTGLGYTRQGFARTIGMSQKRFRELVYGERQFDKTTAYRVLRGLGFKGKRLPWAMLVF